MIEKTTLLAITLTVTPVLFGAASLLLDDRLAYDIVEGGGLFQTRDELVHYTALTKRFHTLNAKVDSFVKKSQNWNVIIQVGIVVNIIN